jgi:hypothetical protein
MDRKDLLELARMITRLVRKRGRPGAYIGTVDLLVGALTEAGEPISLPNFEPASPVGATEESRSGLLQLLSRVLTQMHRATGITVDPHVALATLASECRTPEPLRWPNGPPAGLYVTSSRKAAEAAISRYTGATQGAASFTDWRRLRGPRTVDLQPSQDHTRFYPRGSKEHREPTGIFSPQLSAEPSGTLIAIGPLPLSEHEQFETAERLHEACFCALENGHRIVAVIRTPQPTHLVPDLLHALDIPDYFDREYVRLAFRGTVHPDGRLVVELPPESDWPPPASDDPKPVRPRPRSRTVSRLPQTRQWQSTRTLDLVGAPEFVAGHYRPSHLSFSETSLPPLRRHGQAMPVLANRDPLATPTRAWWEGALALSAHTRINPHPSHTQQELTPLLPLRAPRENIPKDLITLLAQAIARRKTGLLLLGGQPASGERQLLLCQALSATEATGPAALVLPAFGSPSADRYLRFDASDAGGRVYSRTFPHLPLYPSFEAAYAAGHERIVMEYECEPYRPLSFELVTQYASDVCFLLCVDDIDARAAFEWTTAADWDSFETLIGIITWVSLERSRAPVALCDGFVPNHHPLDRTTYACASEALCVHRQLQWEMQAIQHLDSHKLLPDQLRHHLCASGLLDANDQNLMIQTARLEGLRIWLYETLLGRCRTTSISTH